MYCTSNNEINTSHLYFYIQFFYKLAVKYVYTNNNNKAFITGVYYCI